MKKDSNGESGLGNISDFSFANSTDSECDKTEDDFSDFEEEFYLHGYKAGNNEKGTSLKIITEKIQKETSRRKNKTPPLRKKSLDEILRELKS
ncbi:Oidioi.mRNA.OKI2018_I69.chr1.g2145.t1.cds [Oikopleura dioica]|uniref:Oidioi.mRNA.OKI2018_I69.chr1.g2145.t1.cds n=1 Tax=Oikopleura dioica TaxID=34765 RepID=A0ABN7SQ77_OIKDI|nr:Oidioi.mRNA.OKI2018_I69.chr1.g2145.t1.cds [Oikopleura dioica]